MPNISRYKQLRALGICTYCGKVPAEPGKAHCSTCRRLSLDALKRRYEKRISQSLCVHCGKPRDSQEVLCLSCQDRQKKRLLTHQITRPAQGLCVRCGKPTNSSFKRCQNCLKQYARYAQNRVNDGICRQCTQPANIHSQLCDFHHKQKKEYIKHHDQQRRLRVIAAYGNKCDCCGETEPAFLTIDHIDCNGSAHRKQLKGRVERFLEKNNYPPGYRILCWNCNAAEGIMGGCPHKRTASP